jgi:hypothetical protein
MSPRYLELTPCTEPFDNLTVKKVQRRPAGLSFLIGESTVRRVKEKLIYRYER